VSLKKYSGYKEKRMEGDEPAAAASPRVAVTTNPKADGKPRKRKTKRLYGATRTESGANLQRASPGRYVQASPGTITAWQTAVDAFSTNVDPETGRPVDVDLVAQGNEVVARNLDEARTELGIDASDADVSLRAADRSIQEARDIAQSDPERAGVILAASNVDVELAQAQGSADDFRFDAVKSALERTHSDLPETRSVFTPSRSGQSRASSRRSLGSATSRRQLSFDDPDDILE
jgi:hypothetical protein